MVNGKLALPLPLPDQIHLDSRLKELEDKILAIIQPPGFFWTVIIGYRNKVRDITVLSKIMLFKNVLNTFLASKTPEIPM